MYVRHLYWQILFIAYSYNKRLYIAMLFKTGPISYTSNALSTLITGIFHWSNRYIVVVVGVELAQEHQLMERFDACHHHDIHLYQHGPL